MGMGSRRYVYAYTVGSGVRGGEVNTSRGRFHGKQSFSGAQAAAFWTEEARREWISGRSGWQPGDIHEIRRVFAGMARWQFEAMIEGIRREADSRGVK